MISRCLGQELRVRNSMRLLLPLNKLHPIPKRIAYLKSSIPWNRRCIENLNPVLLQSCLPFLYISHFVGQVRLRRLAIHAVLCTYMHLPISDLQPETATGF